MLFVNILVSLLISYVTISFGEYFVHKYLMHQKTLPAQAYQTLPYLLEQFQSHAIRHHGIWYRQFDYEPDLIGRQENLNIRLTETGWLLLLFSPVVALYFWVSPLSAGIFVAMIIFHGRMWNLIHNQMHLPKPVFFADWALFRWLACNHYLHHQSTNRNYNVAFPLADYIMGSYQAPRRQDLRELMRLGYVKPQSQRAQKRLALVQHQVKARRLSVTN